MRVDVFFGIQQTTPADVQSRVVAVIDVLRASTTIATALASGARAVIPFESSEEAVTRAKQFDRGQAKLAGERRMHTIPGFDLGNSPLEFTREVVEGKTILLTTTNGTPSLLGVQNARDVVVAAYANFSSILAMLRAALGGGTDVSIICAGRDRQFSLEDAACAGRFARQLADRHEDVQLNDAARASMYLDGRYGSELHRLFEDSAHGAALLEAGFGGDLDACAAIDSQPVIPVYADRQITMLGPDRER